MKRETVTVLAKHVLFRKLAQAEKAALFSRFREETVGANSLIFQESGQGDSLYVVITGTVMLQRSLDGAPVPIAQLLAGETFGETALLSAGPRLVTAKAISPGLVARLSQEGLAEFAAQYPQAAMQLRLKLLEHFMIKVRHLQPLWEQLLAVGLQRIEGAAFSPRG